MVKRISGKTHPLPKRARSSDSKKLDLYARHRSEYLAGKLPVLVRVRPARYLSVLGRSEPGSEDFSSAVAALYAVAFTVKMTRKAAGRDYAVPKLEALWWLDGHRTKPRADNVWNWQLLNRVPSFVTHREVGAAIDALIERGKAGDVQRVQLVELDEGECVQILHVGPYDEEHESIEKMRAFAAHAGRVFAGKHHEIYLNDPRRVPAERLRTILRQPVA